MRRDLIVSEMVSLDGHFSGPDGQLDWFAADAELEEHLSVLHQEVGAYLYGRRTYQGMAEFWRESDHWIADFLRKVPKYVVSRSLETVDWDNSHLLRDLPGDVEKLKQQPGKAVFVAGSGTLTADLIRHGLVDEYRLMVNPVLLGTGMPLFRGGFDRRQLELTELKRLGSGLVMLHYRPEGSSR